MPEDNGKVYTSTLLVVAICFCILLCLVLVFFSTVIYFHKRRYPLKTYGYESYAFRFNRHRELCESMRTGISPTHAYMGKLMPETRINPLIVNDDPHISFHAGHSDFSVDSRASMEL
jgi:hypothetical protein